VARHAAEGEKIARPEKLKTFVRREALVCEDFFLDVFEGHERSDGLIYRRARGVRRGKVQTSKAFLGDLCVLSG
jgi:hypothetical protein